jgi:hypothetical protein
VKQLGHRQEVPDRQRPVFTDPRYIATWTALVEGGRDGVCRPSQLDHRLTGAIFNACVCFFYASDKGLFQQLRFSMLPETATHLARIQAGAASMMELPAEAF